MRFDTPIYFQRTVPGEYDPATGDYGPDTVKEEKRYASVTSSGVETLNLIYGELRQGCLTLRLQTPYNHYFDKIKIGEKVYRVDFSRVLRTKHVFVVSEIQGGVQNGDNLL